MKYVRSPVGLLVCLIALLVALPLAQQFRRSNPLVEKETPKAGTGEPVRIAPFPGLALEALPRERLAQAFRNCRPDPTLHISSQLHALRLWGVERIWDDPRFLSPEVILRRVLDHRELAKASGGDEVYLIKTRYGARFAETTSGTSYRDLLYREAHVGQTLSVLGELGIPLSQPIHTCQGPALLREVLDDTTANFNTEQELDWATVALALYLPPETSWRNKYGKEYSFDSVAEKLLERPLGSGSSCAGTHTLYTLVTLCRVHARHPILQPPTRDRIAEYLAAARDKLMTSQRPDGSWDSKWADGPEQKREARSAADQQELETQAVLATGHHLEWMALAPPELRVSSPRLLRASEFICLKTAAATPATVKAHYCPYTHGPRAIRLLLGDVPPRTLLGGN